MYASASRPSIAIANKAAATKLSKAIHGLLEGSSSSLPITSCTSYSLFQFSGLSNRRHFAITRPKLLKEHFPPPKDSINIKRTPPAWKHPGYTKEEMDAIKPAHRKPDDWADQAALMMVKLARACMNTATGYSHPTEEAKQKGSYLGLSKIKSWAAWSPMSCRKWLIRFLFLESVAGVPGSVGTVLRHLRSLRYMKRDNGWIETLIEESQNERMHLLTFQKLAEPEWFMRTMVILAQGVFFNLFFVSYCLSPRICHRFVGYLEEEAVLTYTRAVADLESGLLPKWKDLEAPEIAVEYWDMPEGHRMMKDLLLYIRADEAKHREVNHTLANLDQNEDPNPFVSVYNDATKPHPSKGLENHRPTGWERKDVM